MSIDNRTHWLNVFLMFVTGQYSLPGLYVGLGQRIAHPETERQPEVAETTVLLRPAVDGRRCRHRRRRRYLPLPDSRPEVLRLHLSRHDNRLSFSPFLQN
jgi:hypothetical protein